MKRSIAKKVALPALAAFLMTCGFAGSAAAGAYRLLFYHNHTIYSDDNAGWEAFKPSVAEVVARANTVATDMGMEGAVTITDHNNIDAYFDPGFAPIGAAVPIKGEEWSGDGHAGALNFAGDTAIPSFTGPDRNAQMVVETHARGGTVIANHPRSGDWETDRRLGVDGIEVWSIQIWDQTDEKALAWWQRLLASGERVTAVGGSDVHFKFLPIESPSNLVWAESNSPDDMMTGVREGRVMILGTPRAPRVLLTADTDGDGDYDDAMIGDALPIAGPTSVDFQAAVEGAVATDKLVLVDETGTFYGGNVGEGPGWVGTAYRFTRTFSDSARGFVRAELRNGAIGTQPPYCLTNPIYGAGASAPIATEGEVGGIVRVSGSGATLDGVTIQVIPGEYSSAVTAADGSYSIVVPNGTYAVQATKQGYATQKKEGVVVAGGAVAVDFDLKAGGCGSLATGLENQAGGFPIGANAVLPLAEVSIFLALRRRTLRRGHA